MKKLLALLLTAALLCGFLTACNLTIIEDLMDGNKWPFAQEDDRDEDDEQREQNHREEDGDSSQTPSDRDDPERPTSPDDAETPSDEDAHERPTSTDEDEPNTPAPPSTESDQLSDGDIYQLLKEFFFNNHTTNDRVVLGDFTRDGITDMLVVTSRDQDLFINGYVYSPDAAGNISLIYTNQGSSTHAGGFYSWYLRPQAGASYTLAEESFGMWQGFGVLSFTEYYLDANGNRIVVDELILDTSVDGVAGEDGVKDQYMNAYTEALNQRICNFYDIFHTHTHSNSNFYASATTDPLVVFAH